MGQVDIFVPFASPWLSAWDRIPTRRRYSPPRRVKDEAYWRSEAALARRKARELVGRGQMKRRRQYYAYAEICDHNARVLRYDRTGETG